MAQAEADGYIFYPGLTGFPCILGHEFSGVVVEAGKNAFDKRTNKPFKGGEPVTSEEMLWCAQCRPCADGQPNHCERLDEVGFNVNGAYAKYMVLPSRTLWSLEPLRKIYKGDDIFIAGSLAEPTSVAYNAVIERGGGIRPGDRVVILGGGPIGLAACAILKRAGASQVIISEPQEERTRLALQIGADFAINPLKEDFAERVLEITEGMGADPLYGGHRPADDRVPWHRARHLGRPDAEQPRGGDSPCGSQDASDGRGVAGTSRQHHRRARPFRTWQLPACDRVHGHWHGHDPHQHQEDHPGRGAGEYHQAANGSKRVQDHICSKLKIGSFKLIINET